MARKITAPKRRKAREAAVLKQQKPVFRTSTWVTLLLLIAIIAFTYYLNQQQANAETEATPAAGEETAPLFSEQDGTISNIEIISADPTSSETVKLARGADNVWALELPFAAEADQGLVEAAVSQLTALNIVSEVDADATILGLDEPAYVITVEFAGGAKHTLEVGDSTPTNKGYYVRVDKKKIVILTLSGIDAITTLAQFPPYLNTPTPSPLPPTPTSALPTPALTTPEATVTSTP